MEKLFRIKGTRPPSLELTESYPVPTKDNALDLSIAKWQFIVNYYVKHAKDARRHILEDGANLTCGLCLFYKDCKDCPAETEDETACSETPYIKYYRARTVRAALAAARRELAFLQSLKT